jgi:DNA-binding MarR family transcriptional regulator/GNAT superfamily N-acetyltransferase
MMMRTSVPSPMGKNILSPPRTPRFPAEGQTNPLRLGKFGPEIRGHPRTHLSDIVAIVNYLLEVGQMDQIGDRVAAVRAFNRFYTDVIGLLDEGLLETPYSLTEARVLFELGQREATEVSELREATGMDAGYLSRILSGFQRGGLVTRRRSSEDGRRQVILLTTKGRRAFRTLDRRSGREVERLLEPLPDEGQRRLLGAMAAIREVLERGTTDTGFVLRPLGPGDHGWVVYRHGVLYDQEYGWDETFEALVARIVADHVTDRDPRREAAWIAEVDGRRAGCVFCCRRDDQVAQLRLLLVEPWARGMGIGTRLVEECVRFAERAGYRHIMLWTNDVLEDARRVYERAGFVLKEEEPHTSFGHELVGQNWWRAL